MKPEDRANAVKRRTFKFNPVAKLDHKNVRDIRNLTPLQRLLFTMDTEERFPNVPTGQGHRLKKNSKYDWDY